MSGLDTSIAELYIEERLDGVNAADFSDGNIVSMTMRGIADVRAGKTDPEKAAQLFAFNAALGDKSVGQAIEMMAKFDPQPDHPRFETYQSMLSRLIAGRSDLAAYTILAQVHNLHTTGDSVVDSLSTSIAVATEQEAKRLNDAGKAFNLHGPDSAFFEWSIGITEVANKRNDLGVVKTLRKARKFGKVVESISAIENDDDVTIEHALQFAETTLGLVSSYEGLFTEDDRLNIVARAEATYNYLRVHQQHWEGNPGYAARVSAFALVFNLLQFQAVGPGPSLVEFDASRREHQREQRSKAAAEARTQLTGAATIAKVIEEPVIDLEAYSVAQELSVLVNPKKDEVKKLLGETSKRIDVGDNDPLVRLMPCPEDAQAFAKKLIFSIAESKNPDRILELMIRTAERNPAAVFDPHVKATIMACRWVRANIAALAHPRHTYRSFPESQMVKTTHLRYAAFTQAQELAHLNN